MIALRVSLTAVKAFAVKAGGRVMHHPWEAIHCAVLMKGERYALGHTEWASSDRLLQVTVALTNPPDDWDPPEGVTELRLVARDGDEGASELWFPRVQWEGWHASTLGEDSLGTISFLDRIPAWARER